jgi:hypothetical protein
MSPRLRRSLLKTRRLRRRAERLYAAHSAKCSDASRQARKRAAAKPQVLAATLTRPARFEKAGGYRAAVDGSLALSGGQH